MLNCSPYLKSEVVEKHLTYFMLRMQCSGYDQALRYEIIKSAFNAYDKMKENEENEGIPMYRNKIYERNTRRKENEEKKRSWFKKGGYESVMFVTATKDSQLRKEMQTYIHENSMKIKVIEKSGTKVIRMLQKNDPFRKPQCEKLDCFVCMTSQIGNCRSSGITYKIECEEENCPYIYHGQTSSNAYTRGLQHFADYTKKRDKFMWKHTKEKHNEVKHNFKMSVTGQYRNASTKRQIAESIRIQKVDPKHTMNDKSEWNNIKIPRIRIE